jgi:hypothetical protein
MSRPINQRFWVRGVGYVPDAACLTTSRTGDFWAPNAAGVWQKFGPGVLPITDAGFFEYEQRQNKCTNYNAAPPALIAPTTGNGFNAAAVNIVASGGDTATRWAILDESAALAATPEYAYSLSSGAINGRVYEIDNLSGAATAYLTLGGATGNTNLHSLSLVSMKLAGNSTVARAALSGGEGIVYINSPTYTRITSANITPGGTTRQFIVAVSAGGKVRFLLNDLQEGAYMTPTIAVSGAAATRYSNIAQFTGLFLAQVLASKSFYGQTNGVAGGQYPRILQVGSASMSFATGTSIRISDGTNNADAIIGGGGTSAGSVKAAFGMDASSFTAKANGGTQNASLNPWNGTSGAAYLGNIAAGNRALNGALQKGAFSTRFKGAYDGMTGL